MKNKKNPIWFYFVIIAIPFVVILLSEIILVSMNYGKDYTTFVKISDDFPDYKFFNPVLPQKYFGKTSIIPSVIPDGFKEVKDQKTFRIFALGGSTTAGFPHPANGSFPRLLKKLLEKEYPYINFEVINLGISAINTITISDIITDVLDEEPNLIVIYAGHNEFYGALGAASSVSGFFNLDFTKFVLKLKNYRIVQFVENFLQDLILAISKDSQNTGTLMSEMAGKNLVSLDSENYRKGIEQFESNLEYILSECSDFGVPTFVATLASNLMQEPLCKFSGCNSLMNEFSEVKNNISIGSKEKLYEIKDRDELRFRAPEKFNEIIKKLGNKHNSKIFDVQLLYENSSQYGIIGENIMLDHLHPSFEGNLMIAKLLADRLRKENLINSAIIDNSETLRRRTDRFKSYSALDSTLAALRIKFLKSNFPFTSKSLNHEIKIITYTDSLANDIINGKISWENAHIRLANRFMQGGDIINYTNEMNVLINDKPFDKFAYLEAIKNLDKAGATNQKLEILIKYYENHPNFDNGKKIAGFFYSLKNYSAALYFYSDCLKYNQKDPEVYFNLSSIYFGKKDIPNAIKNISKCLEIDSNYPNAQKIYTSLMQYSREQ